MSSFTPNASRCIIHLVHSCVHIAPATIAAKSLRPTGGSHRHLLNTVVAQLMATLRRRWSRSNNEKSPAGVHHHSSSKIGSQKMQLIFTCNLCDTSNTKMVLCEAYRKGLVVLECDGCLARHQMVSDLKWIARDTKKTG